MLIMLKNLFHGSSYLVFMYYVGIQFPCNTGNAICDVYKLVIVIKRKYTLNSTFLLSVYIVSGFHRQSENFKI